ncbi:hypothetical protein H6G54_21635 [Anabaena cylindrica FACHB-243]|uniref:Uncharacterized protein n=1 Tax=Anabaena cylindrica (strain ATCC 27899 / PCC 7122) TaxID=272123 RepID=K9ZAI9_ANACC|nr:MULTISPECIES: hypothetical protein [Anabaena]AFZ55739.1 hypothetical protein Anacy_0130 [Anabaena cylindrica PCC 7122]MBD2420260.1 hypothetical protein [Anabaena cylindrica FACHB-243]MBY5282127.1 hypothetical protein [Anabaena sp. CCAP 1446/1C]MBY5309575.1 hypothetical protein [Anabaena sp. CCAP 1446/1C]MCM2406086.1 hypothetical protein [Anabaena sp. CCAP 1446/1C]
MSIFYNAFFIKTQKSTTELKERFCRVDIMPESEWIVCNFGDGFPKGLFEPGDYLTKEISEKFGEVIFICIDSRNDQLDYEHSKQGTLLRKLSWLSDGCQSTWACVEGEREEWEDDIIFTETASLKFLELMRDDLTEDEFSEKRQKISSICQNRNYIIDDIWPYIDATIGISIQKFFGIKIPISL